MISNTRQPKPSPYDLWLQRIRSVQQAYDGERIDPEKLHHFQRYILEFGEFNANFTLEELAHLNYPRSPFNIMHRHTYLRNTETWATEILRQLYYQSHEPTMHDYPVFIDSHLFLSEVGRYCTALSRDDILAPGTTNKNYKKAITDNVNSEIWVQLTTANEDEKEKITVAISRALKDHLIDTQIPAKIRSIFKKKPKQYSKDEKDFLDTFLKVELDYFDKESSLKRAAPLTDEKENKKKFGLAFSHFKKHNKMFLDKNNLINATSLQAFAETHPDEFDTAYQLLEIPNLAPITTGRHDSVYTSAIQEWTRQQLAPHLAKIYFYMTPNEKFMGLDCLVLLGSKDAKSNDNWGPKSLINRLGYRVEMARAVTAILKKYPLLFIDREQTTACWHHLVSTPMISDLPEHEQAHISSLCRTMFEERKPLKPIRFEDDCERFENYQCERSFNIYKKFIDGYIADFRKFHKKDSVIYDILMPTLHASFMAFLDAYRAGGDGDLPAAVRAVQTIGEMIRLDLAFSPHDKAHDLTTVIKDKLLKNDAVQSVMMAPFGMRAYLRVLQASKLSVEGSHRPKIYVTNQNYFEWLLNLRNLQTEQADITHIRQLEDISKNADYIFAEAHPNNATEKKQFQQNMSNLIDRMIYEGWDNKQRTLVFDATLNAFDDQEMREILDLAKPLIDCGALNIIIMQSLTKFSQLGLDERSGGLTVVINNGTSWEKLNHNFKQIEENEPVDHTTLQYFSYFFNACQYFPHDLSLTVQYINAINHRVNFLYAEIMELMSESRKDNHLFFKLTSSSDPKSCYLSFNTSTILSFVDPEFKLRSHDIERLNEDIISDIFIPLCRHYDLPLTARMSIAFPLSSVNVACDSIRLTVGLESYQILISYAKIINYIAQVLNNLVDHETLFERNSAGKFEARMELFKLIATASPTLRIKREPVINPDFQHRIYGPFKTEKQHAYFLQNGNQVSCYIGDKVYYRENMVILQELIVTPCLKVTNDQFDFFLRGAGYEICDNANEFLSQHPEMKKYVNKQYKPLKADKTYITFAEAGIAIERDIICTKKNGMTIFKRFFSYNLTAIEADYWQEKDAVVSRFMTFALALYIKGKHQADFMVRGNARSEGSMYTHFLFKMKLKGANKIFSDASDVMAEQKTCLLQILKQHADKPELLDQLPYTFCDDTTLWKQFDTSCYNGPTTFPNSSLVNAILTTLKVNPATPKQDGSLKKTSIFAGIFTTPQDKGQPKPPRKPL
tara:strand:+ start:1683 stop:5405 length:3723 start_codon:yes stop_codon:yes gene_type:complete